MEKFLLQNSTSTFTADELTASQINRQNQKSKKILDNDDSEDEDQNESENSESDRFLEEVLLSRRVDKIQPRKPSSAIQIPKEKTADRNAVLKQISEEMDVSELTQSCINQAECEDK